MMLGIKILTKTCDFSNPDNGNLRTHSPPADEQSHSWLKVVEKVYAYGTLTVTIPNRTLRAVFKEKN